MLTPHQRRALMVFADGHDHRPDWLAEQLGYNSARSYLMAANVLLALGDKGLVSQSWMSGELEPFEYAGRYYNYRITQAGLEALKEAQ